MSSVAVAGDSPTDVPVPLSMAVDIRPGLCPNHLRLDSPLTIPIAVLGTMDFDVANIDPETVRLSRDGLAGECAPASWAYADVGIPVIGASPECNRPRGDGLDDLELRFSIQDLATTLGLRGHIGETIPLTLTGKIVTGQGIEGFDCVMVIAGPWGDGERSDEIGILPQVGDEPSASQLDLAYYTNTSDHITVTVYDARGRVVAELVDADRAPGIYQVTWDGTGQDGQEVAAGTYFARVSNSWTGTTKRLVLSPGKGRNG
jgi:hypothetical protein